MKNLSASSILTLLAIAGIAIIAILFGLQVTAQGGSGTAQSGSRPAQRVADGTIVYATIDIPRGAKVTDEAIAERALPRSDVPQDAVSFKDYAIGKKATYGFTKGQVISVNSLSPKPGECDYKPCGTSCLTDEKSATSNCSTKNSTENGN